MKRINKILINNYVLLVVLILSAIFFYSTIKIIPTLQHRNTILNKKIDRLNENITLSNETIQLLEDPKLRLELGRQLYQISKDGEIIFIFPEENEDNVEPSK